MSMLLARVQPQLVDVDVFPCLSTPEPGHVSGICDCGTELMQMLIVPFNKYNVEFVIL